MMESKEAIVSDEPLSSTPPHLLDDEHLDNVHGEGTLIRYCKGL